jgi:hypothetical protein
VGLILSSYFSDKWGQNLRGQITMRRYGASAMQPPSEPSGDVGVRAACLTGVVSAAPKSPSRLRRLFRRRSMVMWSSSTERRCSSSAHKSAIAKLFTGTRGADARGSISEHECAADGAGTPPERFAYHPPWGVVLMAVTTSWLTS